MTTSVATPVVTAGTWTADAVHSDVSFKVRHMAVGKAKGTFALKSATLVVDENGNQSVTAEIDAASVDTKQEQRDAHIKSADFFETGNHTVMTFRSTGVRNHGEDWVVEGDLTIKGITQPVTLALELNGFGPDAYGGTRAGFSATATINRSDFGVDISMPLDGGGVVVSEKVQVALEIEAVLRQS